MKSSSTMIHKLTTMIILLISILGLHTTRGANLRGLQQSGFVPPEPTVYLIRHANKQAGSSATANLCSAGMYRADQLQQVFSGNQYEQDSVKFATPNRLFAYVYKEGDAQRCEETLTPIHDSTGLYIHQVKPSSSTSINTEGAEAIRNGEYGLNSAQVVLAAWEHVHLEDMSLALGMTQDQKASLGCDPPFPDDHTFGNIYTFTYGNGPAQPPTSVTCHKEGITIPEEKYTDPSNTCAYNPYN